MNFNESSATRLIERMEREEFITKVPSELDKRVTFVKLTKSGENLFNSLLPYGDEFNNDLIEGIDADDLDTFERVLEQMSKNITKTK